MAEKKTFKAVHVQKDQSFKVVDVEFPTISDNDVLVKVEGAGISPADLLFIRQRYFFKLEAPHGAGFEGAGVVAQVGKKFAHRFKLGDRVSVFAEVPVYGTWAEYTVVNGDSAFPIHPENSFAEATYHFGNPVTALQMLKEVQKEGHKAVVQSAAASNIGRDLIRLFKENGIKTINIVRRDDVKDELTKIGADYVLNSNDPDFEKQLEEIAKKEHATKFYDAVAGELTVKVLRKLPYGSTISIYGALGGDPSLSLTVFDLFGGKTLGAFSGYTYYRNLPYEGRLQLSDIVQSKLKTTFSTKIVKTFSLEEIEKVIELSEKNASEGKPLIKP